MFCTFCGRPNKDDANFCVKCGKPLTRIQREENSSASKIRQEEILNGTTNLKITSASQANQFYCVDGFKSPNTCCLWVSLDYWNLYLSRDKLLAARCYRGKWGLIGFIIGLFLAFVGFLVVGSLGILWDRSRGEAKCHRMKNRLNDIINNREKYKVIEASWNDIGKPDASDLCLGSIWLQYKIELPGKKFYFEKSKLALIESVFKRYQ